MAHLQPSKQQLLKVIHFAHSIIKAVTIVTISALVAVNAVAGFSADVDFTSPSSTNFESQNTGTDSNIIGTPSLLPPPFLQPKPESNLPFTFPAIAQAITYTCVSGGASAPCLTNVERTFTCENCAGVNSFVYAGNVAAIAKYTTNDVNLLKVPGQTDSEKTYTMDITTWDKSFPMIGGFQVGANYVANAIRVLGITGGNLGIVTVIANSWKADLSDVENVLTASVHTSEMTYQWQKGENAAGDHASWVNISETTDSYTRVTSDFMDDFRYLRLIATDIAPESTLDSLTFTMGMKITSNAIQVIAPPSTGDPAPVGTLTIELDGFAPGDSLTIVVTDSNTNNLVQCVTWQAGPSDESGWNSLSQKGGCTGTDSSGNINTYMITLTNGGTVWNPTWTLVRASVIYRNPDDSERRTLVATVSLFQNISAAIPTAVMALPVTTGSLEGNVIVLSVSNLISLKNRNAANPGSVIFKAIATPAIAAFADADLTANAFVVTNTISASDNTAFRSIVTHHRAGNTIGLEVIYISPYGFTSTASLGTYLPLSVDIALNGAILTATPLGGIPTSFQWQQSATETGTYSSIAGANARTYTVPTEFNATLVWVRMSTNTSGTSNLIKVGGVRNIGAPVISFPNISAGSASSIDYSRMQTRLGTVPTEQHFNFQWQTVDSGSVSDISSATSASYLLNAADFNNATSLQLRLTDKIAPNNTFTSNAVDVTNVIPQVSNNPPTADLAIVAACENCYFAGQILTAVLNINENGGGPVTQTFAWMRGKSSESGTFIVAPDISNVSTYILAASFQPRNGYDVLLVSVEISNTNGSATLMMQTNINRPTNGVPILTLPVQAISNTIIVEGIDALRDGNNNGGDGVGGSVDSYIWTRGTLTLAMGANESTYIINTMYLQAAGGLKVVVNYRDDFGYAMPFTLASGGSEKYISHAANILNLVAAEEVANAIDTHLHRTAKYDPDSVYWEWFSKGTTAARFWLNDVEVSGGNDLTRALASRTSKSTHTSDTGTLGGFAVDSASAETSFEDSADRRWTAWANVGWHAVDGKAHINERDITYRGTGFGLYTGADVRLTEAWRAGAVYGRLDSTAKAALHDDSVKNDTISREMNAIMPYLQYASHGTQLRMIVGAGFGNAGINEVGDSNCKASADLLWQMFSINGAQEVLTRGSWGVNVLGAYNYSNNTLEETKCNAGGKLPEIDAESGESKFGLRLDYNGNETFRPYFGVQGRSVFGGLSDDIAYDAAYGVHWEIIGNNSAIWSLAANGKTQLNQSKFRRDNVAGAFSYQFGSHEYYSASSAIEVDENGNSLTHRIEWNQEWNQSSAWGINTINSGIYVQRRDSDKPTDSLGAKVQLNF